MNVREALEKFVVIGGPVVGMVNANDLAPIIEKAARAAIQSGYSSGHSDALGRGPCDGSEERGLVAFVAAMVEES